MTIALGYGTTRTSLNVTARGTGAEGKSGREKNALRGGLLALRVRNGEGGAAQLDTKMMALNLQGKRETAVRRTECIAQAVLVIESGLR